MRSDRLVVWESEGYSRQPFGVRYRRCTLMYQYPVCAGVEGRERDVRYSSRMEAAWKELAGEAGESLEGVGREYGFVFRESDGLRVAMDGMA